VRSAEDTFEELNHLLDELRDRSPDLVILVEGQKDKAALATLGIEGEIWAAQGPNTIFSLAERLAHERKRAIVLTDWDRKGGQWAQLLRRSLRANGVQFDDSIRMGIVILAKSEVKDVEGLPSFYSRLSDQIEQHRQAALEEPREGPERRST
jgi:5S rRNA maturation endonuclease (ribonuclease M5)